jgi:FkbM family methyltransferase
MKSSHSIPTASSEETKKAVKIRSVRKKTSRGSTSKRKRSNASPPSTVFPQPTTQDIPIANTEAAFYPVLDAHAMEISEAHAEFFHSVRCQWLAGDWESLADLQETEFSSHPKRAKIALLVASALHELRAYDSARELLDRAMEWGASRRDVVKVVIGHAHAALGRACLAEPDIPRAEKHFLECISSILPSKSAAHHARERLFKEVLALGFLPDAQKLLLNEFFDFQKRNVGSPAEQSVYATKLELLGHELELALQRGQIGVHHKAAQVLGKVELNSNSLKEELKSKSTAQWGQDLWVVEKTGYKRHGFFVEFGATDGVRLSNTFMLEKEFGWSGLCAEPNPEFFAKLQKNRSCVVSRDCISGQSGQQVRFVLADEYGGINDFFNDTHNGKREAFSALGKEIALTTLSLDDFLKKHDAPHTIDYLSLDTEGSEYEILRNFPFEKWDVRLITVEHNFTPIRDQIRELLSSKGYSWQEAQTDDLFELKPQNDSHG